ncbi:MAG: carboxypeptidase-like regulatory domain-containing protein, partial [Ardenticatenia bacterium]|nr:carboxypeptidase-like regulatory domain-containing protein [Ardenticatenia bacterium]
EIHPRAAVLDALPAGVYRVQVEQVPGQAVLFLDGEATANVMVEQIVVEEETALSRLRGQLEGSGVAEVEVILTREAEEYARTRTDPQGGFLFEELPAGTYTILVPALGVESVPVELDGRSEQALRVPVPSTTDSTAARLVDSTPLLGTYLWLNCAPDRADICVHAVVPVAVDHAWAVGCTPLGRDFARQTITVTTEANVSSAPAELVAAADDPLALGTSLHHVVARVERVRTSPFAAVRGRVEGVLADVRAVQLWAGEVLVAERPLEDRGVFRFERVPPGEYVVRPSGRQEPAWPLVAEANEALEMVFSWPGHRSGSARRRRAPLKYILLGRGERHRAHVLLGLILPLLPASDCVVGFRPEEALGVAAVLLLDDEREFASAVMRWLQGAKVPVSWIRPRRWADVEPRVRQFIQGGE